MNQENMVRESFALWGKLASSCSDMALEGLERALAQAKEYKEKLDQTMAEALGGEGAEEKEQDPKAADPLTAACKEGFDIWERHAARSWDAILRSPLFLESMGRSLDVSLEAQRSFGGAAELFRRLFGFSPRRS